MEPGSYTLRSTKWLTKRKYSQRVRDLARKRIFYIDKEGFLPAFKDAFRDVFTEAICRKAFEASELVPLNTQVMLDRLEVRLRTPPAPPPQETPCVRVRVQEELKD
jgi:hypothetical protein